MSLFPSEPAADDAPEDRRPEPETSLREYAPHELADEILLATVDGVGAVTTERLLARFGDATAVLEASIEELRQVEKIGETLAQKIVNARQNVDVSAIVDFCEENGIAVLTPRDARYPERLREIDGAPQLLYVRGTLKPEDRRAISVVGSRSATAYGRTQTVRLVGQLVEAGFTIVSGLALGIDGYAHRAALNAGGRTIAVLGGGVARIYPREHEDLAARIIDSGALISEYHPLTSPLSGNFPARNRIVSGFSIGTLVVETRKRGGSMITARLAAEQNRELFAVPGAVDNPLSQGCHELIRDGAILVESADDILFSLPSYEIEPIIKKELKLKDDVIAEGTAGISQRSLDSIQRKRTRSESGKRRARTSAKPTPQPLLESPPPAPPVKSEPPAVRPTLPPLNDLERAIVDYVGDKSVTIDEIIRALKTPAAKVLQTITALEFKKVLRRLPGAAVERL